MLDPLLYVQAVIDRLKTLEVCTTGATDLAATATGYTRLAGSFLTDGFEEGMEVVPAGFSDTARRPVTRVEALTLTVAGSPTVQASASGRTLSVGWPEVWTTDNVAVTPVPGRPYAEVDFVPGPVDQPTSGPLGTIIAEPLAVVRMNVPVLTGPRAAAAYLNALHVLFRPTTAILLSNGDTLRARMRSAPYGGQLTARADRPAWAYFPFTIPLRVVTRNTQ